MLVIVATQEDKNLKPTQGKYFLRYLKKNHKKGLVE
jgi:hypothetical protein